MNTHYFQVLLPITTSSSVLSLYTQAFLFAKFHAASYYTCVLLQKQPLLGFYLFRGSFIFLVLTLISLQRLLNSLGLNFPAESRLPTFRYFCQSSSMFDVLLSRAFFCKSKLPMLNFTKRGKPFLFYLSRFVAIGPRILKRQHILLNSRTRSCFLQNRCTTTCSTCLCAALSFYTAINLNCFAVHMSLFYLCQLSSNPLVLV